MFCASFLLTDGRPARLSLRADSTSFAVDETDVSCYDLSGRPYVLVRDGFTYRRALDGRVLQKRRDTLSPRVRRWLSSADAAPVVEASRREALQLLATLEEPGRLPVREHPEAESRLRRIAATDAGALADDSRRFADAYGRVGILPPDQYLALVVQATEGCSWNACTFCDFYRGSPFRVKGDAEFDRHLAMVRDYFGESLPLRRGLFLGAANALCAPPARVVSWLAAAGRVFPEAAGAGISAFVDVWTGIRRRVAQWAEYARLGLRRVYVGLESGDPELLAFLHKPGSPGDAETLVATLHEAGLAVGVIVLLGVGGERFFDSHVGLTSETLSRLGLGPQDVLYLSDFVAEPNLEYTRLAAAPDLEALGPERCLDQREAILSSYQPADSMRPPHVASYDIREFAY